MRLWKIATFLLLCGFLGTKIRAADNPQLWLYYPANLQVDSNIDKLEPIWRRASAAGYTHILIADDKLMRLNDLQGMEKKYLANVERVKKLAKELKLELVPAVFPIGYSNSLLWHDPNLAEGLPVKDSRFVVTNNEAHLSPDPDIHFPDDVSFADDSLDFPDEHTAIVKENRGNARFVYRLTVPQFRCYHISVKIRTSDYTGTPQIKVLAGDKLQHSLQFQNLKVKPTQDFTEQHVVFNSLDNTAVSIYFGVWGTAQGTLEWKDWKIEESPLVNVLRRPGAPLTVKGFTEGKDFDRIVDPLLGSTPWKGSYNSWHQPPTIKTHNLNDGTQLRISWYHPAIIYDDQVTCCLSGPALLTLLSDQARRVKSAFGNTSFMMGHDEIRTLNWDLDCQHQHKDAGAILAENLRACQRILAGSQIYVWSDMFDPFHNATKDYYLVRGDLAGSWEGLDPKTIIVNWNYDHRDESLKFFADRGHRQLIAGYYDGDPAQISRWLASASKTPNIVGVMYTTWCNNYKDLEQFARLCHSTNPLKNN